MMSRKYELIQTGLASGAILVAALVRSVPVALALAAVVLATGVGHVALTWWREKVLRARLEEELKDKPWMLVPGPNA
jgi:hypothetical protein